MRRDLALLFKNKRISKQVRNKKPRKMVFFSREIEKLFNDMPAECQKYILNGG